MTLGKTIRIEKVTTRHVLNVLYWQTIIFFLHCFHGVVFSNKWQFAICCGSVFLLRGISGQRKEVFQCLTYIKSAIYCAKNFELTWTG